MIKVERQQIENQQAIRFNGTKEKFEEFKPILEQLGAIEINYGEDDQILYCYIEDQRLMIDKEDWCWLVFWKQKDEWNWESLSDNEFCELYREVT